MESVIIIIVTAIVALGFYKLGHETGIVFERERRQRMEALAERRIYESLYKSATSDDWPEHIEK